MIADNFQFSVLGTWYLVLEHSDTQPASSSRRQQKMVFGRKTGFLVRALH